MTRKSFIDISTKVSSKTMSVARRIKSSFFVLMFDVWWDNMSPNIDQNSSPKERVKTNQGKHLQTLKIYNDPPMENIELFSQPNIAIRAAIGWIVKTTSKSQQDKIIIMKWHNFFRSCTDLQKLMMTKEFKQIPEKKNYTYLNFISYYIFLAESY